MQRPFARFDWNLRSCGRRGHITYVPDETDLSERMQVTTPSGEAYRCLRCGDFVLGEPTGRGPADEAPIVMRGKALRDALILRLLAVERLIRGLGLLALAYGVYRFNGARDVLNQLFHSYLPLLQPVSKRLGIDLQDTSGVHLIEKALQARHGTIALVALGLLGYGLLELTEAVGLWLMVRWGEYVAVVGTAAFIPFEVYEVTEKLTVIRLGALALNIFAVCYIVWTKRLFGVHGGKKAFEAERANVSVIEVERAAIGERRATLRERVREARDQRRGAVDVGTDTDDVPVPSEPWTPDPGSGDGNPGEQREKTSV